MGLSIIAMYYEAKEIIGELIRLGFSIHSIQLQNPELGYDDIPYIISLSNIETEDGEVWCEPFKRETGYINEYADITYVLDNCPADCLKTIESEEVFEVSIVSDCNEDCSCDHECCLKNKAIEKPVEKKELSSTANYKVNGKEVSREEFEKFKKKVDDEYLDTVRNMLLKHCSIMDEINEMSRLLRW